MKKFFLTASFMVLSSSAMADNPISQLGGKMMMPDRSKSESVSKDKTPTQAAMPEAAGKINSIDAEKHIVNITHDPIDALKWPGMTKDFSVVEKIDLSGFKAGDEVIFKLKQDTDSGYLIVSMLPAHATADNVPSIEIKDIEP